MHFLIDTFIYMIILLIRSSIRMLIKNLIFMLINTLFESFDIEMFVSCNNPSKLILYSLKPIASAIDGDNNSEGKVH